MTSPLRDMAAAASAMARGDYDRRVRATSRDEVGELARAFNAMAAELADVERMRRDLVANVSHELRTPIGALQALLENLADGVEPPDPAALRTALAQTERLGRLVEQLLDLSRLESGGLALEPVVLRRPRAARAGHARVRARRPPGAAEGVRAARRPARDRRPGADAPGRREPARQRGPPLPARRPRVAERARATGARTTIEVADEGPGHRRRTRRSGSSSASTAPTRPATARGSGPRPGDRALDRRRPRRRDPRRGRGAGRPAAGWSWSCRVSTPSHGAGREAGGSPLGSPRLVRAVPRRGRDRARLVRGAPCSRSAPSPPWRSSACRRAPGWRLLGVALCGLGAAHGARPGGASRSRAFAARRAATRRTAPCCGCSRSRSRSCPRCARRRGCGSRA